MTATAIDPRATKELLAKGAVLIDVRDTDEYARERIPEARHVPLAAVCAASVPPDATAVVFHCRSGARTHAHAAQLASRAPCKTYVLEGGIEAWKRAGLPVTTDSRQPIEIMRQVQIAAGSLVLLGVALGALVAPAFYGLAAVVGAGLVLAGVTGSCTMASLLRLMPWNRRAAH